MPQLIGSKVETDRLLIAGERCRQAHRKILPARRRGHPAAVACALADAVIGKSTIVRLALVRRTLRGRHARYPLERLVMVRLARVAFGETVQFALIERRGDQRLRHLRQEVAAALERYLDPARLVLRGAMEALCQPVAIPGERPREQQPGDEHARAADDSANAQCVPIGASAREQ